MRNPKTAAASETATLRACGEGLVRELWSRSAAALRAAALGLGISATLIAGVAHAAYPERTIKFIVPFAAGGTTDLEARIIARALSDSMRQPVIVENLLGAGGRIAAERLAKADPDGYTIGVFAGSFSTAPSLYRHLRYDPIKDFAPVIHLSQLSFVLVVPPSLPVKSVSDLIALAKQKPLTFASGGYGNTMHLAGEMFNAMAGTKIQHIPYKGGAPALQAVLADRVSMTIVPLDMALPYIKADTVHPLGVASAERSPLDSAIPTIDKTGVPGFEVGSWIGVLAPGRTPANIVTRLNSEIQQALDSPEVQAQFKKLSIQPVGGTPEEFGQFLQADIAKWRKVVKDAGIKPVD